MNPNRRSDIYIPIQTINCSNDNHIDIEIKYDACKKELRLKDLENDKQQALLKQKI